MAESDNESGSHNTCGGAVSNETSSPREHDRLLPIANVSRIMKKALPANAKISKEAKETVQECVSEFISFITGEASEKCQLEKRKTINGDDLLWAMTTLGFENYAEPLKLYLQKFRDLEGDKGAQSQQKEEFAGGRMMMMGQQMYGSYHPHHHNMVGKGGMSTGGETSSSSAAGIGGQGRVL